MGGGAPAGGGALQGCAVGISGGGGTPGGKQISERTQNRYNNILSSNPPALASGLGVQGTSVRLVVENELAMAIPEGRQRAERGWDGICNGREGPMHSKAALAPKHPTRPAEHANCCG